VTGTVAVVTGASGAIGTAVCRALAGAGYAVAGIDMAPAPTGAEWFHVQARVDDPQRVAVAWDDITAELGPPLVLVNNAGIYLGQDFWDTTPEQLDMVFSSNVKSAFLCSQEMARRLRADGLGGSIVNVASVSGRAGSPDAAYGASKGALLALTTSLGKVLAPHNIRVNVVAPGIIESAMSARIPPDRLEHYRAGIPLGRFGLPEEVAAVIVNLAGPGWAYVTGAVVDVNGGLW
jgi:NAD(P)-dependent dehydrogenase (short-subunit alcohol dehydrogenase family)